jgi:hypothetical protein
MSRSGADEGSFQPSAHTQSEPPAPGSTRPDPETPVPMVAATGEDPTRTVAKASGPAKARWSGAEQPNRHTGGDGWADQCHHGTR